MSFSSEFHQRRSIRLREYDYRKPGVYCITIGTKNRECVFGHIEHNRMWLNVFGMVVHRTWQNIEQRCQNVALDAFVVMPNHIHGIVVIRSYHGRGMACNTDNRRGTACRAPTKRSFGQSIPGSLSTIVGSYKSACTRQINTIRNTPGTTVWQRNYYESIIRDSEHLQRARRYIYQNPEHWNIDHSHDNFL